jgi:pimeloyl-ACP methyl ester carboxylesterase
VRGHFLKQNYVLAGDETRVHYTAYGEGPALVCTNSVGMNPCFYRGIVERFRERCRVVTWDHRGHGMSYAPKSAALDVPTLAQDLKAVLDDLGTEQAVLVGHRIGVQVVLSFYHQYPKRVAALVLIAGLPGRPVRAALGSRALAWVFDKLAAAGSQVPAVPEFLLDRVASNSRAYDLAARFLVNGRFARRADFDEFFHHLRTLDADLLIDMLRAADEHTAEDMLAEIAAPTLVVAGEKDRLASLDRMRAMRDRVPGADLLVVRGGTGAVLVEQPDLVSLALEKFLRERLAPGMEGPFEPADPAEARPRNDR